MGSSWVLGFFNAKAVAVSTIGNATQRQHATVSVYYGIVRKFL